MVRRYNIEKDTLDPRDYQYKSMLRTVTPSIKDEVDLRPMMSPVFDQSYIGSCGPSSAIKGLREYLFQRDGAPFVSLSVLYNYYYARTYRNNTQFDSGVQAREVMQALSDKGCAPETDMPYDPDKYKEIPTPKADYDAKPYHIREYHRVGDTSSLLLALSEGYDGKGVPVLVGIPVFPCLEEDATAQTGIMRMPVAGEGISGGHMVTACGYKTFADGKRYILCKNSWGINWGQEGYFWMPEDFITFYVIDMWTGTTLVTELGTAYTDAVNLYSNLKIFDSLQLWLDLGTTYANDTTSDFRYFQLAYRKIAAYMINHDFQTPYADSPLLDYTTAVNKLHEWGIFDSPDFWIALGVKYMNVPTSDFRFVSLAIQKLATYIQQQQSS